MLLATMRMLRFGVIAVVLFSAACRRDRNLSSGSTLETSRSTSAHISLPDAPASPLSMGTASGTPAPSGSAVAPTTGAATRLLAIPGQVRWECRSHSASIKPGLVWISDFSIDRDAYGKAGTEVMVTSEEAGRMCRDEGRRLCSILEWRLGSEIASKTVRPGGSRWVTPEWVLDSGVVGIMAADTEDCEKRGFAAVRALLHSRFRCCDSVPADSERVAIERELRDGTVRIGEIIPLNAAASIELPPSRSKLSRCLAGPVIGPSTTTVSGVIAPYDEIVLTWCGSNIGPPGDDWSTASVIEVVGPDGDIVLSPRTSLRHLEKLWEFTATGTVIEGAWAGPSYENDENDFRIVLFHKSGLIGITDVIHDGSAYHQHEWKTVEVGAHTVAIVLHHYREDAPPDSIKCESEVFVTNGVVVKRLGEVAAKARAGSAPCPAPVVSYAAPILRVGSRHWSLP